MLDADGHQIDVHPVVFTAQGAGIYQMTTGGDWIYPRRGFSGSATSSGAASPASRRR
jgi:hypothetical protein